MLMRTKMVIGAAVATALVGVVLARSGFQSPAIRPVDEKILREYTGAYSWGSGGFVYLQLWNEFSGFDKPAQLVAFDEDGLIRVLYPMANSLPGPGPPFRAQSRRGSDFGATPEERSPLSNGSGRPDLRARLAASRLRSTKTCGSRMVMCGWPVP
jgi:hypothetical protein